MQTLTVRGRLKLVLNSVDGQKGLGRLIEVAPSTVGNWAQGKAGISLSTIELICSRTEISPAWLAFGEGPMRKGEGEESILAQAVGMPVGGGAGAGRGGRPGLRARVTAPPEPPMDADTALVIETYAQEVERLGEEVQMLRAHGFGGFAQPPPPAPAARGSASITVLGLAECGLQGWLKKRPLSVKADCPGDMNPATDFAVIATGQSLYYAGVEPGFTCFCAPESEPQVGDVVYVLRRGDEASLGLVKALGHKEKGAEWLILQKWYDLDPETGLRDPYTLQENMKVVKQIAPVIYIQRRPV